MPKREKLPAEISIEEIKAKLEIRTTANGSGLSREEIAEMCGHASSWVTAKILQPYKKAGLLLVGWRETSDICGRKITIPTYSFRRKQ